jgi:hypothetical protein
MKLTQLQPILERQPFRPFGVILSNGNRHEFTQPRNLGAPKQLTDTLFYFGEDYWVLIDVESIVEVEG